MKTTIEKIIANALLEKTVTVTNVFFGISYTGEVIYFEILIDDNHEYYKIGIRYIEKDSAIDLNNGKVIEVDKAVKEEFFRIQSFEDIDIKGD